MAGSEEFCFRKRETTCYYVGMKVKDSEFQSSPSKQFMMIVSGELLGNGVNS